MLKTDRLTYDTLPYIAARDRVFITEKPEIKAFLPYSLTNEGFDAALAARQNTPFSLAQRAELSEILEKQYTKIDAKMSAATAENIEKLRNKDTFTIVTAHQPNLCLGQMYYVYKILSVVKMTLMAQKRHPNLHFVPVFWLGSEDHDLEELNFFNIYNKKMTWQTEQTGAVGRMHIDDLQPLLAQLYDILGESPNATQLKNILRKAFDNTENRTLGDATFYLINALFGKYGVVIIDQDNRALKAAFAPYMQRELTEQAAEKLVLDDIAEIEAATGFRAQAMPRAINLFYHTKGLRSRIVLENGIYTVLDTEKTFSESEILNELAANPQHFSPNVVLRPLFQEVVLPNIAYIGGGGELAYWLERRRLFAHFGLPFPLLVRRQSALLVAASVRERIAKTGFDISDFWSDEQSLIKQYLARNTENTLDLAAEKAAIDAAFQRVLQKTAAIDQSLEKTVLAEQQKNLNSLEQLEQKIVRAEKRRHETALQQVQSIKEKLFPERGLQERFENFMPYYVSDGAAFFDELLATFEPFFGEFLLLEYV